jgi:hypothetical protein
MRKKLAKPGFEDYEIVKLPKDVVTFGTSLYIRNDGAAIKVVFPTGHTVSFEPLTQHNPE